MSVGFGIIGCGTISTWHAEGIAATEDAFLAGVTDARAAAAESFAAKWNTKAYAGIEELLHDDRIQVVCICTPSGLHAQQAIQVLESGKNVLVEKPMALNIEDCDRMIEIAEKKHLHIGVVSQLRFADTTIRIKHEIENGTLGRIVTGDVVMKYRREQEYYSSSTWRGTWAMDGGGALMNQGIHGVDLLLHLMGDVKHVYGLARTLAHDIEVEDTASAVLEFSSGALGMIQGTTSIYPGYPREISVSGTKGTIAIAEQVYTKWEIQGQERPADIVLGGEQLSGASVPTNLDLIGHRMHIADMVHSVKTGCAPIVDGVSGRRPVALIRAIYASSQSGKRVDL